MALEAVPRPLEVDHRPLVGENVKERAARERGLILFSFYRWKGERVALILSSALFMIVHLLEYPNPLSLLMIGAEGLYWGWVALRTRNIVGIAVSHTLFNFTFSYVFAA